MTPAGLLPPVQAPPHDPRALAVGPKNEWGRARYSGLHVDSSSGVLELDASAATQRLLTESNGSFGGLVPPSRLAVTPDGDVFLIDRRGQLSLYDACQCRFNRIASLPGDLEVTGMGCLDGNLYICGGARLVVMSLMSFSPRAFWKPPSATYSTWLPFDVAFDARGRVYVSDVANGCIHRFSRRGTWLSAFTGLGSVSALAIDCRERLYAIVHGSTQIKVIELENGNVSDTSARPEQLRAYFPRLPFLVDREGRLHFTTRRVFDLDANLVTPNDKPVAPFLTKGSLTTSELDSGIYRCVWHRVVLVGELPDDCEIEVESFTSEIVFSDTEIDDIFNTRQLTRRVVIRGQTQRTIDALIQSEAGRYLWLRLVFRGSGGTTPAIRYAEVEFPRISLRRFLPTVFGEEAVSADFTDRFLALFDTTFRSVESRIDNLARYFDPSSTPGTRSAGKIDFLSWLASWLGVSFDRHWPEERRRRFLKQAGKLFPLRGTRIGLWSQLVIYLGMGPSAPPLILEQFRLRRWLFVGMGRLHDQAVLWGRRIVDRSQLGNQHAQVGESQLILRQDPPRDPFHVYAHQFSVFVPARIGKDERARKGLENLLKAESPAHTKWTIHYVEPRFRIGFQSMIGLDAVIARYPIGVRLQESRLRNGTVLGSYQRESDATGAARIGRTTTLRQKR
jgi:phage tail-like protein